MDQQVDGRFESVTRFYTQEQFSKIRMAHIAVIGLGGVGSWCVEALARTGINQLTLVDMDDICVTNINRQVHALDETVGHLKVDQLEKRALAINPSLTINKRPFFTPPLPAMSFLMKNTISSLMPSIRLNINVILSPNAWIEISRSLQLVRQGEKIW